MNKMTTFKFVTVNENLDARQPGEYIRTLLLRLIEKSKGVVLDFTGVDVVSNSFTDECLVKLLFTMPLEELKQRTTFRGLSEFAHKNIAITFRRRLNAMNLDAR